MRIKESNKWKVAFTMYIGAYEPTVIYFGLTNFSATFQTIINDLFHDIINQENITTFIDNIIVAIDTKKEHGELVKKVLNKLKKNDLFVKLEKY